MRAFAAMLEGVGAPILAAGSGEQRLPGIDGLTTAHQDYPVLLASASGLAEAFLQKPVDVERLRGTVRAASR